MWFRHLTSFDLTSVCAWPGTPSARNSAEHRKMRVTGFGFSTRSAFGGTAQTGAGSGEPAPRVHSRNGDRARQPREIDLVAVGIRRVGDRAREVGGGGCGGTLTGLEGCGQERRHQVGPYRALEGVAAVAPGQILRLDRHAELRCERRHPDLVLRVV